jgi:hypothetical protein
VTDYIEDVGTITATWTDPTGTVWQLSETGDEPGWFTTQGPAGWDATTYEIITDPQPRGGESVREIRSKPGRIVWPFYAGGDSHLQYIERRRQIKRAFTMTAHRKAVGVLRVERPDGPQYAREIEAFYEGGLEGEAGQGWLYSSDAVTLFCPDGYWRSVEPITTTRSYTPGVDFLNPFPSISDSLALGATAIDNPGDVTAWPAWTITGPMSAMAATNLTTGQEFALSYPLIAGEQITITTQRPTVRGPAGQNLSQFLNWPSAYLWGFAPGENQVILNLSGGDVGASITATFHARYEGA